MKKYILTALLSITIFCTSFSCNVFADNFPYNFSIPDPTLHHWRFNFDPYLDPLKFGSFEVGGNGLTYRNMAFFYDTSDSTLKLIFQNTYSSNGYTVIGPGYEMAAGGSVSSISSASYNMTSADYRPIYLRMNFVEYVNLLSPQVPVFQTPLDVPYRTMQDSYISDVFVSKFSSSFVLPQIKVDGSIDYKNPGAMMCSYNEATGVISCTDPNTDYDFDYILPSASVSGTVSSSSYSRLYVSKFKVVFDDYYTGSLVFDKSLTGYSVDGGVAVGNTVYMTDSKELTIFDTYIVDSGSVPSVSLSIQNFYLMSSRLSNSFVSSAIFSILSSLDLVIEGYDDMEQSSENITNSNGQLSGAINDYDSLEKEQIDNMTSAIDQIDTNNGLFQMQDFIKSSQWVSTQLLQVYNSNTILKYIVTFSLLTGLSLMIIGRRWH